MPPTPQRKGAAKKRKSSPCQGAAAHRDAQKKYVRKNKAKHAAAVKRSQQKNKAKIAAQKKAQRRKGKTGRAQGRPRKC